MDADRSIGKTGWWVPADAYGWVDGCVRQTALGTGMARDLSKVERVGDAEGGSCGESLGCVLLAEFNLKKKSAVMYAEAYCIHGESRARRAGGSS
jgi:hypothetical protein